jgi:hypothetical protein
MANTQTDKKCKGCLRLIVQEYPTVKSFCNLTKEPAKPTDKACKMFVKPSKED